VQRAGDAPRAVAYGLDAIAGVLGRRLLLEKQATSSRGLVKAELVACLRARRVAPSRRENWSRVAPASPGPRARWLTPVIRISSPGCLDSRPNGVCVRASGGFVEVVRRSITGDAIARILCNSRPGLCGIKGSAW